MKAKINASGRAWAYVGTILGVSVSAAANAAETMTNPDVPGDWERGVALGMGLLPVGLFVALEVLVRNVIKRYIWWWRGAMLITAVSFAVPSYSHMHDLLVRAGQNEVICYVTPIGWDGMMLLSTLALLLPPSAAAVPTTPVAALTAHGEPLLALEREVARLAALAERPAPEPFRVADLEPLIATLRADVAALAVQARPPREPRVVRPPAARQTSGPRQRYRPQEHPLWDAWVAAQRSESPWDDDRLAKELRATTNPGATADAARALRNRWTRVLAEVAPEPST